MIEIKHLCEAGEDGGSLMGFYAKGSIDRSDFAAACNAYTGADPDFDRRYVRAGDCRHEWWRCVPISGEPGFYRFSAAAPDSKGAFQVTVWDGIYWSLSRHAADRINAEHAGVRRGWSDGIAWAMRLLEKSHPQAAHELLDAWRTKAEP